MAVISGQEIGRWQKIQSGTQSKGLRKGHSKKYCKGLGKDSSRSKAIVPGENWAWNAGKDTAKVVLGKGHAKRIQARTVQ